MLKNKQDSEYYHKIESIFKQKLQGWKNISEKILDKDTSLVERICTLFCEWDITIMSVTALSWQSCWSCTQTCMALVGKSEKELF